MGAVTCERRPPIRHVRLDTGRMNVLDLAAVRDLRAQLTAVDPEAPVVLLRGRDDALSAGLDLATLAAGDAASQELLVEMGELLLAVYGGPTRLVVACAGHAVAAGAMLLLVADLRVGAAGPYKVGFTEPAQGMPLPELPVVLARARLDRRHLESATLLGRVFDAAGALEAGFLDELVPAGDLDRAASERAATLATLASEAYTGTIRAVRGDALARMETLVEQARKRLDVLRARAAESP